MKRYGLCQKKGHFATVPHDPNTYLRDSFALFLTTDMLLLSITFFYTGLQVDLYIIMCRSGGFLLKNHIDLVAVTPKAGAMVDNLSFNFSQTDKDLRHLAKDPKEIMESLQIVPP